MKSPSDGNIEDITERCEYLGVPPISLDQWIEPKVFTTLALSRIATTFSSNTQRKFEFLWRYYAGTMGYQDHSLRFKETTFYVIT